MERKFGLLFTYVHECLLQAGVDFVDDELLLEICELAEDRVWKFWLSIIHSKFIFILIFIYYNWTAHKFNFWNVIFSISHVLFSINRLFVQLFQLVKLPLLSTLSSRTQRLIRRSVSAPVTRYTDFSHGSIEVLHIRCGIFMEALGHPGVMQVVLIHLLWYT